MKAERHLRPLVKENRFQDTLSAIESYVDELEPGARLHSERELANTLDVSRPLIRQAIKVLEGLGRVESRPGSGTFVLEPAQREAHGYLLRGLLGEEMTLAQVVAVRKVIESAVIDAVVEVWDGAIATRLSEAVRHTASAGPSGGDVRIDLDFEALLGALSGNTVLQRLQSLVHGAWLEVHRGRFRESSSRTSAQREHALIVNALSAGDAAGARVIMMAHIDGVG